MIDEQTNINNNSTVDNNITLNNVYNNISRNQTEENQTEEKLPWYETNNQLKKFAPKNNETPEDALYKLAHSYIELEKKLSSQMPKIPTEYQINTEDIQLKDRTVKNLLDEDELNEIKERAKILHLTQEQCQDLYHMANAQKNIQQERYLEQQQRTQEEASQKLQEVMGGDENSGEWADSVKYISAIADYGTNNLDSTLDIKRLGAEINVLGANGVTEILKLLRALGKDYVGSESNLRMKERTAGFYGSTPADVDYGKYSSKTLGEQYLKLVQSEAFRKGDANVKSQAENLRNILQKRGMLL